MPYNSPTPAEQFISIYDRRRRASIDDAKQEVQALVAAVERIGSSVDGASAEAEKNLAAGKLFEIAGELKSAETAYRRVLAEHPLHGDAAARMVFVLLKLQRFDEALELATDLFTKSPTAIWNSLVYEGPCSVCVVLADVHRLMGNYAVAAGLYREAARLEGGTPYNVNQAIVTMALAGEEKQIPEFAEQHADMVGGRVESLINLSRQTDDRLAIIQQVAARTNVAGAEMMWVDPLELVTNPAQPVG